MVAKLPSGLLTQGKSGKSRAIQVPWLSQQPFERQLRVLGALLLVFLLVGAVFVFLYTRNTSWGARYVAESSRLLMLSQRLAADGSSALSGNAQAFESMETTRAEISSIVNLLDKGSADLPPTAGGPRDSLNAWMQGWQRIGELLDKLVEERPLLVTLERGAAAQVDLLKLARQVAARAAPSYAAKADRLYRLIEETTATVQLLQVSAAGIEEVQELPSKLDEIKTLLGQLPQNDATVMLLRDSFEGYESVAGFVVARVSTLLDARQQGQRILETGQQLFDAGERLVGDYQRASQGSVNLVVASVAGVLSVLSMLLLFRLYLDESRRREHKAAETNRRTQEAILRLMNELAGVADGDLTVRATVSEDITGAIADSVNYTIDELRKLVTRVLSASQQVTRATSEAGNVTKELLAATQKQAAELREAGSAIELMVKSIQEVDQSAAQSAAVARRSQEVTEQGARAVQHSIAGMDGIREQIQETSKRIKRLGESSQEIGEIVDLISDITEQTNVLALNAAIQAASAGEAGRGFAVVAEEVQRLAERSAEATRQIAALVKTIQGDTQDAVAAMEKSTQGVVEGARLSDAAGQSLAEIEKATRELAGLVNSISVSTQVQTDMAREVTAAMNDMLRITEQTSQRTQRTSAAVAQLEALAGELNSSVSGFKL